MNPRLSLAIGIFCIAFSAIFVKLAGAAPITAGFYRVFIAWLPLAVYVIASKKISISRTDLGIALLAGIVFASDISVWNISILKISATISTLLANLAPVWVGLFSLLLLKKRSGLWFWLGTVIALAGMIVLVGFRNLLSLQLNAGILYAILASMLYATYILLTKNVLQRVAIITFMFYSMLSSSVYLALIGLIQHTEMVHFPAHTWWYFLGMGLVCQLTGWLTINHAISYLPATKTSVALLGQTVATAVIANFILGEVLNFTEIIGSVIVLAGIAVTFVKRDVKTG